ncbi:BcsE family c-di-GMP-binding protein, partial [Klebsiella pneumoniae]|uniref:BcsE family c-di-GMP-binding protein n=1 Tax=Klebsiella pneumoniae TaxID=573 RepID=UPI00272FECA7
RQRPTPRPQRGTALTHTHRQQPPRLRATEDRLLHSSGASLVIPRSASLSRGRTLIESGQTQKCSRPLPAEGATRLTWSQPGKLRGYQ